MESGDEDDAFTMGEREWQKMSRDLSKQGYRDGKTEGREKGLQRSFEQATREAFSHTLKLGQILGLIEWKATQVTDSEQRKTLEGIRNQILKLVENLKNLSESEATPQSLETERRDFHKLAEEVLSLSVISSKEAANVKKMLE